MSLIRFRLAVISTTAVVATCSAVSSAQAAGSNMPWEAPLQSILESIQGPVARIIAVIIIIATGLTLAFGDTSGGFRKLMEAFDLERCGNATMSLAIAQGALDYVLDYVQQRKQFGKPIVDFQAVQLRLADMAMKVEASRLLIYQAVWSASEGLPSIRQSSIAKCFANEMVREVTGHALQMMGAYGYSKAYPMEQRMRDAWGWGIAGGAIDIQKTNIASALVGRRFDQRR